MIAFANKETTPLVRRMWKICFKDTDEFMDLYFSQKYKEENTLIYFEGGKAVASLQMLPYSITFYGETIPFAYLSGLCTLPEYRRRGYMDQLIHEAHRVIEQRKIPLAILIPAEDSLYGFYERYEYEQVFEKDNEVIPLKQILEDNADIRDAYQAFNAIYSHLDFCIQKSEADFRAIIDDCILEHNSEKSNLSGMARIISPLPLLQFYAKQNQEKEFKIKINTPATSTVYSICKGKVFEENTSILDLEIDLRLLCRLLFGFKIKELDSIYTNYFSPHHPIMNLMLE